MSEFLKRNKTVFFRIPLCLLQVFDDCELKKRNPDKNFALYVLATTWHFESTLI